jgi:hypothetical protein
MPQLSVSEAARRIGSRPTDIGDLFYGRERRDDPCPIVAGHRVIPEEYLPQIEQSLRWLGRIGRGVKNGK